MNSNPWDNPPMPISGDLVEVATFAGVGRVMSRWEEVEVELSRLYSMFVERPNEAGAIREYGKGRIFHDRLTALNQASATHFARHPSQDNEASYGCLRERTIAYSNRRNDVAHGIVRQMRWIKALKTNMMPLLVVPLQYCLVPPHYLSRRFDANNAPSYAYTSESLLLLDEGLYWHADKLRVFCARIFPDSESS